MKEKLREKRNKIYYEIWENYKNELTMEELAEIFAIPLPSFYKIIKKGRAK